MVMRRLVLRGCLLVGGVCVGGLVFVFWLHAGAGAGAPSLAAGVSGRGAVARLAGLPPAEQAVISRTLGAVSPGFAVVRTPGGYGLSAGGLRAHFGRERALFAAPGGGLSLALRAVGRGAVLEPFRAVQLGVRSNRVSYSGVGVGEWFVGGPLGIEQGFTLARRPAGGGGPLTLALRVSGLTPRLGARGAVFADAAGRPVLRYGALAARDARGRALAAWLVVGRTGLEIQIADRGARYPVRVDPFIQLAKLTASDGAAGDELGSSVAVSGDTVVAGAPDATVGGHSQQGAVYVFTKPAAGWSDESQAAKLTASDGAAGDQLGSSVAVSGDTVVAGAPDATVAGHSQQGAVYVFTKPAAGWSDESQAAKLTVSDGAAGDQLGSSVAVSGDTVVAGALNAAVGGHSQQGAAYVFTKPAAGWSSETQAAKLTASDGAAGNELGESVAVSGDTIAAGAPGATVGGHTQGAAYVFIKPAAGWSDESQAAKLTASDGATGEQLGSSVAVSGDTVVAGAVDAAVAGHFEQGAAYVFTKPAAGWSSETQEAKPTASDGAAVDELGRSVAVSGDTIVAGAPLATVAGHSFQGAAYVFAVVVPPSLQKAFGASSIPLNGSTSLSFTVTNPNGSRALSGVGFTDSLPAGLVVSSPNGSSGSCGSGTVTATAGSGSVSLSGGTIAAGADCSFSVNVTGTSAGVKNNTTGNVTSTEGGTGNTASASLTVVAAPSLQKAFGASSIPLNGSTSLSFTVTNPNGSRALSGVGFTDSLPAGLVVSSPNGSSGSCGSGTVTATAGSGSVSLSGGTIAAGADCSFSVNVTGTSAGVKNNTTGNVTSTEGGTGNTASASLTVVAAPTATISSPADNRSFNLGQSVSTTFSCSEAANGPGIGSCTDQNGSSSPAKLDTSKVGTFTYRVTATSKDGQTRTAQVSYTVVGRPTAQISSPAEGQKFNLRQSVSTTFSCSEAASAPGISSCTDQNGSSSPGKLDTSKAGTFTYKVTATSKDGQTATATISYTVKHPIPRLRSLRLSRRRFYAATHRPTIAALETGTTITYTDTLAARTTFRVLRCAARGRRPCSRLVSVGSFAHRDHKGINRVRFTGWLRGRPLTPGSYVLRLSATLAGQKSTGLSTSFQIVARPPACSDPDNDGDCPGQT